MPKISDAGASGGGQQATPGNAFVREDGVVTAPPSGVPTGTAAGDLSGTYPNPVVSQVGGQALPLPLSLGGTGQDAASDAALLAALGAATLASPALTGTPTAPTAGALTSSTQLATTAYADSATGVEKSRALAAEALLAPVASPVLTGTPAAPTASALTSTTQIATTAYADSAVAVEKSRAQTAEALLAPVASPALTGSPTAPTQTAGDSSTKIATDAFVAAAVAARVVSGQFLCTPTSYAPGAQTSLSTPAATTVAAGSNGGEISTIATWSFPSAGVLDVASTAGWPTSGTVAVAASGSTTAVVTYTGTAGGNQLTGCAYVSGSATGTVATGGAVSLISFAAFSSANVNTGSFTAPASGSVMVTVTFTAQMSVTAVAAVGLAAHGTVTPLVCPAYTFKDSNANTPRPYTIPFLVTGLTPGTSYNFDPVGAMTSLDTLTILALGTTSTTLSSSTGAPVTMTVQAV